MMDSRPTPDQLYLASRLNGDVLGTYAEHGAAHRITPAAIQRWNLTKGTERTTAALRLAWGFGPPGGPENPYAYVAGILRGAA